MSAITMRDLLCPDRVMPLLRARDKRQVLRTLAERIARDTALPKGAVSDAALGCADLAAWGPGGGVALPHAFVAGLERPLAAFARLDPAVDFGAADGRLTDLVMLLISPLDRSGVHLRALAVIARRLRMLDVRRHLRAANSPEAIYIALTQGALPALLPLAS